MPFHRFPQARPFITLAALVIGWMIVPVVVKSFVRASFFEFTAPITVTASHARDLKEYWSLRLHSNKELIEAGIDLARLNASYDIAVQTNTELRSEITRLESLLRLPSFANYRYEHARVARRDFSGWWQRIVIRKGKDFGILEGAPVVFSGGVVGRVTEVHATTSIVELISSQNVRLAGVVEGDTLGRPISFQGGVNPTFGPPTAIAEFVPLDVMPNVTHRIVTSGLGGVFPPGLTLGTMTDLKLDPDGLFETGVVKLDERLGSLTEVTVLVPLAAD